jgi:hypothetical protein
VDPVLLGGMLGIGGALAGSVVPLGWQDWRDHRTRKRSLRYVALALSDELLWVEAGLARITGERSVAGFDRDSAALRDLWMRHERTIESMDAKGWGLCRVAMRSVERLAVIAEIASRSPERRPMSEEEHVAVTLCTTVVLAARKELNEIGGIKPPALQTWEEGVERAMKLQDKYHPEN